ncbi:uncharacterized protein BJX67DRAFT_372803 [Aspergillus lucknowensis]|uniref:Protein kinase domain-containing protein n=1 Tax=Aspergillus lucknowensis TaxID=176173 RepID=A0ABR4LNN7_9EURO
MEVIQKNEAFKRIDGKIKFSYIQIFTLEDLQEIKRILTKDRGPEVNTTWLVVYIKTPSLLAYINGNLEKQITREVAFLSSARELVKENIKSGLEGILAAIKYLYLLGLVYNNINPINIMLDKDSMLILINFNSC